MRLSYKNLIRAFFIFASVYFLLNLSLFAEETSITIDFDKELGPVNKKVFGNNFIGYDPMTYENWAEEFYGYSDYGAGLWDPAHKESVKEAMDLARRAGITTARFPGGCGVHHYDWKMTIRKDRKHFLYGLDEFLKTCEETGAEPLITVSDFTGDEQDGADLIEYLNIPAGQGFPWAQRRAQNGHLKPYGVKYFEIGNEVWHGDHRQIKKVSPQDYARRYLKYYQKMKAVDSSVKIGVVLHAQRWDNAVMTIVKDKVDFGIVHVYPGPQENEEELKRMKPIDIFTETLEESIPREETGLLDTLKVLKEKSKKDIPLAITEYNGGFLLDDSLSSYRHSLGIALLNAELLRIFMKLQDKILMANFWEFVNEHWGMIANGFDENYEDLYHSYYKRPNYFVFEIYHEHFGELLIEADVKNGFYKNNSPGMAYLSVNASKNEDGGRIYMVVINKNVDKSINSIIDLRHFVPSPKADVWILNSPSINATNEKNHCNIKIKKKKIEIKSNAFQFIFEPHSLTAIEIDRRVK